MMVFQSQAGDWHDDNYTSNEALANRMRDFYFKNIVFDGRGRVQTCLNFWTTKDVVFDNCEFLGATGEQDLHIGAWCDNFWARGCHFKGRANKNLIWDGTHGSGLIHCKFDNFVSGSVNVVFLSNDDCSRDVNGNGQWDPEELRLSNYIVVANCIFGEQGDGGRMAIAASSQNTLILNNQMLGGGYRFFDIAPRATQMTHQPPMPGYDYRFTDHRIVGNVLTHRPTQFVQIRTHDNRDATPASLTRDGQPNGSVTGRYEIRGNSVPGYSDQADFIDEVVASGNPMLGPNRVSGNGDPHDPDFEPNSHPGGLRPEEDYSALGSFRNSGVVKYYLDGTYGSDENPGTSSSQAWKTFRHAIEHMTPASTLIIRGGLYELGKDRPHYLGGERAGGVSVENATIIRAYTGERVILTGPAKSGGLYEVPWMVVDGDYIRLEGLWIGGDWDRTATGREMSLSGGGRVDTGVGEGVGRRI